jgi:hypothetical protein
MEFLAVSVISAALLGFGWLEALNLDLGLEGAG